MPAGLLNGGQQRARADGVIAQKVLRSLPLGATSENLDHLSRGALRDRREHAYQPRRHSACGGAPVRASGRGQGQPLQLNHCLVKTHSVWSESSNTRSSTSFDVYSCLTGARGPHV